jgi:hypothetical protein
MALPIPDIAAIARDAPPMVRLGAGVGAAVLLVFGAEIYRPAMYVGAFGVGGAIAAGVLWGLAPIWPVVEHPGASFLIVLAFGGLVAAITGAAHRYGLVAIGFVSGGVIGAAGGAVAGGGGFGPIGAVVGGVIGAVSLPWVYEKMLPITTSVVGATLAAFALGRIETPWIIAAFAIGGSLFQLVLKVATGGGDDDDEEAEE